MKTIINIKADKEVKEGAQKLAKELGLPLSTVINAYLKEFIRGRSVSLSAVPRMSHWLEERLAGVEKDIVAKKNMSPLFKSGEDAVRYLKNL